MKNTCSNLKKGDIILIKRTESGAHAVDEKCAEVLGFSEMNVFDDEMRSNGLNPGKNSLYVNIIPENETYTFGEFVIGTGNVWNIGIGSDVDIIVQTNRREWDEEEN